MSDVKKMTAKEFREMGLLQEVNRLLLHPMGLALETVIEDDGTEHFGEVWDYRDDPEGMCFGDGMINWQKAADLRIKFYEKMDKRWKSLGYHIQTEGH